MAAFRNERDEVDKKMERMFVLVEKTAEQTEEIYVRLVGDLETQGLINEVKGVKSEVVRNTLFRKSFGRNAAKALWVFITIFITGIVSSIYAKLKGIW